MICTTFCLKNRNHQIRTSSSFYQKNLKISKVQHLPCLLLFSFIVEEIPSFLSKALLDLLWIISSSLGADSVFTSLLNYQDLHFYSFHQPIVRVQYLLFKKSYFSLIQLPQSSSSLYIWKLRKHCIYTYFSLMLLFIQFILI